LNDLDHDGDAMAIYPLFTKEATEEAKIKMHPRHSKSNWQESRVFSGVGYSITLDAATAIYNATLS
jgi:hypothetical protein